MRRKNAGSLAHPLPLGAPVAHVASATLPTGDRLDQELAKLPRSVWDPVFQECADRIRSLGKVSGTFTMTDAAVIRAVEGMGCPVRAGRVSLTALDRAMREGRLVEGLLAVTERWIGMSIVTKPEERANQQRAWAALVAGWHEAIRRPLGTEPIDLDLVARLEGWSTGASPWIKGQWGKRPTTIDRSVRRAIDAARQAPGIGATAELLALPVFAQQVAGNPHALDAGRTAGRLFIAALRARFRESVAQVVGAGAEARAAILDAAGLSMDGVSSRVVTFGLAGPHPLFGAAASMQEPLTLTALNLEHMNVVTAPSGIVHVVENPAVFTHLVRALTRGDRGSPAASTPSLVCTSGQFGVTAAMVLDRLARRGATIWYSGDFDTAGIYIADRLWRRYPGQCVPWRMTPEDYHAARHHRSDTSARSNSSTASARTGAEAWTTVRTQLLDVIQHSGPAYQEGLVHELVADVQDDAQG